MHTVVTTTFSNPIRALDFSGLLCSLVRPVREHGTAIDCEIDHSGQLGIPNMD